MTSTMSLAEANLQLINHEDKLFESLLKLEFRKAQILKEDGDVSSQKDPDEGEDKPTVEYSEGEETKTAVKENIFKRIVDALKKAFAAIGTAVKALFEKISAIFTKDHPIIKKFADAINNVDNRKGYPGIKNFRAANPDFSFVPAFTRCEEMYKFNSDGKLTVNPNDDSISKSLDGAFLSSEEEENWIPKDNFKINPDAFANNRAKEIKSIKAIAIHNSKISDKDIEKEAAKLAKKFGNSKEDYTTVLSKMVHDMRELISTYQEWYKSMRKIIFDLGTYCIRNSHKAKKDVATDNKEEAKTESFIIDNGKSVSITEALCWIAGEESDNYVNEMFGLV